MKHKDFHILSPFTVKAVTTVPGENCDAGDSEIIKISGAANYYGDPDSGDILIDLANEVVNPTGMDVTAWKSNPQILWQHDRHCTIGRGLSITKKKSGVYIEAEIHSGAMEPEDFYRIKAGLVTRLSVGFRVIEGSFKQVGTKNVYVIEKSKLFEVSVVSLPCNEESSFQLIKSLPDDEGFYAGELTDETVTNTLEKSNEDISINDQGVVMKEKFISRLTEAEIQRFKELGMSAKLDEEVEVDAKAYIDSAVKEAVAAHFARIAEKEAEELEAKEAQEKAAAEEAEALAAKELEEKAAQGAVEEAGTAEEVKALAEIVANLKALVNE